MTYLSAWRRRAATASCIDAMNPGRGASLISTNETHVKMALLKKRHNHNGLKSQGMSTPSGVKRFEIDEMALIPGDTLKALDLESAMQRVELL